MPSGVAARPLPESRLARLAAEPGKPVKARPAVLHRGMRVNDAFQAVMAAGIAHLQANERGVLDRRNPEYLHQMRVALRRLRSAIDVFGLLLPAPAVARAERSIRWLAASLGPARDWDVLVKETLPAFKRESRASGGITEIAARCEMPRARANARALRAVRSLRYRRLHHSLAALAQTGDRPARLDETTAHAILLGPVDEFASAVLNRRHGQAKKRGRGLAGLSARELHRLRIAVKKFRYAADFFADLYEAKPVRRTLKRLARLQDILGEMNDTATALNLIAPRLDHAPGRRAIGARDDLRRWSRSRTARLKRELRGAWKDFRSARKFW